MLPSKSRSKLGDVVEEGVPEVIPPTTPPPTRIFPFVRLREKIVQDTKKEDRPGSTASANISSSNGEPGSGLEVISSNEGSEALPPHQVILGEDQRKDTEGETTASNNIVPVSANIDRQDRPLQEEPSDRPGAFRVAGIDNDSNSDHEDEDDVAPSVNSVIMNVEDPPIFAELVAEPKQIVPIEVKRINEEKSWPEKHWKKSIGFCIIVAVAVCLSISLTIAKKKTLVLIELEDICTYVNDRAPWLRGAVSANWAFLPLLYSDSQFSACSSFPLGSSLL